MPLQFFHIYFCHSAIKKMQKGINPITGWRLIIKTKISIKTASYLWHQLCLQTIRQPTRKLATDRRSSEIIVLKQMTICGIRYIVRRAKGMNNITEYIVDRMKFHWVLVENNCFINVVTKIRFFCDIDSLTIHRNFNSCFSFIHLI